VHDSSSLKPRDAYKNSRYDCFQGWKQDETTVRVGMTGHVKRIKEWITKNKGLDCDEAFDAPEPVLKKTRANITPRALMTPPPTTTTVIQPIVTAAKDDSECKRPLNFYKQTIKCNGRELTYEIPTHYKLVLTSHISKLKNDGETLQSIKDKIQSSSYTASSFFSQSLWAILMSSIPALAFSAAQFAFPMMMYAFLYDTGLFKYDFDMDQHVTAFPSDWYLRKLTYHQAARDTMFLGDSLVNKQIFMSCDKGNKKGVGHFVKVLSWWNSTRCCVSSQLLDIDASGGNSADCALAIQASINKLKMNDDDATHKLAGQCADSGGGGVLDGLAKEMAALNLTWLHNYLIANCTIHALQLQLSNAVINALGAGSLDKVNAMQLLHSTYALQEALDLEEWRHMLIKSSLYVVECGTDAAAVTLPAGASKRQKKQASHKAEFEKDFNMVYSWHSGFKKTIANRDDNVKGTVLAKMQKPILTRWWTVGVGAAFVFEYYLIIFHAAQMVINTHKSDSSPYKIASALFSMMKDPANFIDITLIRGFNKAYIHKHLDWLQSCDDLSSNLGFSSHHMAIRYYLMRQDLSRVLASDPMKDYVAAVEACGVLSAGEKHKHMTKLQVFMKHASDSLDKHFIRWISPQLLPAGLLSEYPTARVIGAAMLGKPLPMFLGDANVVNELRTSGKLVYKSTVHGCVIDLKAFSSFICKNLTVDHGNEYTQEVKIAAELIVEDQVDMRSFKCQHQDHGNIRLHMHSTYLPLASQTQFVESEVKTAKLVAQTDRSEELRTCVAMIRSLSPLGKAKEEDSNNSYTGSKIKALVLSAWQRSLPHVRWKKNQVNNECDARLNTILYSLSPQGHFKDSRVEAKKARVDEAGLNYKKQNQAQQVKPQHKTPAVTGLIPYSRLTLAGTNHMEGYEAELCHRGVDTDDVPNKITGRKALLQQLEIERLINEGVPQQTAQEVGKKHFKKQSTFEFVFADAPWQAISIVHLVHRS